MVKPMTGYDGYITVNWGEFEQSGEFEHLTITKISPKAQ